MALCTHRRAEFDERKLPARPTIWSKFRVEPAVIGPRSSKAAHLQGPRTGELASRECRCCDMRASTASARPAASGSTGRVEGGPRGRRGGVHVGVVGFGDLRDTVSVSGDTRSIVVRSARPSSGRRSRFVGVLDVEAVVDHVEGPSGRWLVNAAPAVDRRAAPSICRDRPCRRGLAAAPRARPHRFRRKSSANSGA